jgi:hypothetical protein
VKGLKIDSFGFLTPLGLPVSLKSRRVYFQTLLLYIIQGDHTKQVNILLGVRVGWELGRCQQSSEKSLFECFLFPKFQEFKAIEKWKQGGRGAE